LVEAKPDDKSGFLFLLLIEYHGGIEKIHMENKIRKTLIFSDVHLEAGIREDTAYELLKRVIAKEKFDNIIIDGDFLDLSYISHFTEDTPLLTEGKRLKADFDYLRRELKFFKKHCKGRLIYLEGNHEERVQKMVNAAPVLDGLVSIDQICRDEDVEYIQTNKQPMQLKDDLYIAHGLALTKFCSATNVEKAGVSIITGHSHRTQLYTTSYLNQKPVTGISLGCISTLSPEYVQGKRIPNWSRSFGILRTSNDYWDVQLVHIKENKCIVGDTLYE
jgi:predicted phosphodiesterase